jgi:hypothetical protein
MNLNVDIQQQQPQEIQVSQKWRTNGALRCRRDYHKR